MHISKFLLFSLFSILCSAALAQTATIKGVVKDSEGNPLPGIGIRIKKLSISTISNETGSYLIDRVPAGKHTISFTAIGYKMKEQQIDLNQGGATSVSVTLIEDVQQMQTIQVYGRTKTEEVNKQAFNVTAIDAKKLYNTTLDISGVLDRVAGVRVRESGGVGSNFSVSLNGFSGRHVRYFIDGIPMDNFGSSFQINNIPINLAERVEIYKGVVPIWLGSDALGGAVNIVTNNSQRNYLDASYSYGSFNTHRSVINTAVTSKSGLTLQLSAFQNYSDNNYWTDLTMKMQNNMQPELRAATVRRFHDTYHNETMIANVGVVGKPWADNFLLGITLGKNYKEMQTAARADAVYGQLHRRGNILMPSLKYKKVGLVEGLDVTVNANYNLGYETSVDTARATYDWDGIRDSKVTIGELTSGGLHREYRNNNGLATAMVSYKISERQSVAVNNVFSTFDRKSENLLFTGDADQEPKSLMNKNVLGFGYSYAIQDKWNLSVFGKYILLKTIIGSADKENMENKLGYGTALSYFITPSLQIKGSYELTNRMPEANEVFGDLETEDANPSLKPEKSDNFNLGIIYGFKINDLNRFSVNANAIYRNSTDFIFRRIRGGTGVRRDFFLSENRDGVRTTGFDAELRYSFMNWLTAGTTVTYQRLINLQKHDFDPNTGQYSTSRSLAYEDQMPNLPYLFGNADVSGTFRNVLSKGNNLTVGYNFLYVHDFWLDWPSFGTPNSQTKNQIPEQMSHDVNMVYSMKNGRYNISFEVRNIADKPVFDNFALQKPGRSFYLNLRYFINKSQH